ncbi:MAG: hypothetical protein PUF31_00995 [Oscillospiraceae bacterium]|nr:hypothetical protein [Oscillospiraceae bacterium]MDD6526384.1 hypothetical protein [Oscillospiraceae bacterium]
MNKTLKKFTALILSLVLAVSVFAVGFTAFAEGDPAADTTVVATEQETEKHGDHATFFQLIIDFFKEIGSFIKYIFYDMWLGRPAPPAPTIPDRG